MNLPPYHIFPVLSSNKIVLRQALNSDLKDNISIQFYDSKQAQTEMEAIAMQEKINADYNNGNTIHWAIADKNSNNFMGTLGYYRGFENGVGELGCVLLPQYRGQGIMTEALSLAIDFGYNVAELNRVMAIASKENIKAIKLLERLGFILTTELKDNDLQFDYPKK